MVSCFGQRVFDRLNESTRIAADLGDQLSAKAWLDVADTVKRMLAAGQSFGERQASGAEPNAVFASCRAAASSWPSAWRIEVNALVALQRAADLGGAQGARRVRL
jgi:hypothetical protein